MEIYPHFQVDTNTAIIWDDTGRHMIRVSCLNFYDLKVLDILYHQDFLTCGCDASPFPLNPVAKGLIVFLTS